MTRLRPYRIALAGLAKLDETQRRREKRGEAEDYLGTNEAKGGFGAEVLDVFPRSSRVTLFADLPDYLDDRPNDLLTDLAGAGSFRGLPSDSFRRSPRLFGRSSK